MLLAHLIDYQMIRDVDDEKLWKTDRVKDLDLQAYDVHQKAFMLHILYPNIDMIRFKNIPIPETYSPMRSYDILLNFQAELGATITLKNDGSEETFDLTINEHTYIPVVHLPYTQIKASGQVTAEALFLQNDLRARTIPLRRQGKKFKLNERLTVWYGRIVDTTIARESEPPKMCVIV